MPKPLDPVSYQAHCDWLVLADPGDPPTEESEGTALHLYFDPAVLASAPELGALASPDPERIGSAAWQAIQVAANREDPTMEWAGIIKAWDRADAAYREQPAFLNQLRRHQRAVLDLVLIPELAMQPPVHPGLGVDTWVLMASNGERGGREQLAPLLQLSEPLFARIEALHPGLLGEFEGEREWSAVELTEWGCQLADIDRTALDRLTGVAVGALQQAAASARQHGWVLSGEGPDESPEWDLGDLLGDAG